MNFLHPQSSTRQLVILGLSIPILLAVLVGWLQWQSSRDFRIAREWVNHSQNVQRNLDLFLSCLKDAETGQRGYLLTHRDSYLRPYREAMASFHDQLESLHQLISDNPGQQKYIVLLSSLTQAKLDELAQTISLEQQGNHTGALQIVMDDSGNNLMEKIRAIVRDMQGNETSLLIEREDTEQRSAAINSRLSVVLIALGLISLAAILFLLHRLDRLHSMITICAWSKMIEYEGQWLSIEDYLTRRLHVQVTHGISKVEAEKMLHLLQKEKPSKAA